MVYLLFPHDAFINAIGTTVQYVIFIRLVFTKIRGKSVVLNLWKRPWTVIDHPVILQLV